MNYILIRRNVRAMPGQILETTTGWTVSLFKKDKEIEKLNFTTQGRARQQVSKWGYTRRIDWSKIDRSHSCYLHEVT